jgi:hypothetical protein
MKKGFRLVDQKDVLTPDGRCKKNSGEAPHSVSLGMKSRQFLEPLDVTETHAVFFRTGNRSLAYMQWDLVARIPMHDEIDTKGFSKSCAEA